MPFWLGLFGVVIAVFSPGVGLMFSVSASGHSLLSDIRKTNLFFTLWVTLCVFFYIYGLVGGIEVMNLCLGAGISGYLMFMLMHRNVDSNIIFATLLFYNCIYILAQHLFLAETLATQYKIATDEAIMLITARYAESPERLAALTEMIKMSGDYYILYQMGLWTALMMLCLTIGYFFTFRKRQDIVTIASYQNHVSCTYCLVSALIIAIFTKNQAHTYAVNFLIGIYPLYLMQGIGVLVGMSIRWFSRVSPLMKFIAVFCLVFNPYIMLFIALIGLFDCWLDFRKLNYIEEEEEELGDLP